MNAESCKTTYELYIGPKLPNRTSEAAATSTDVVPHHDPTTQYSSSMKHVLV